MNPVPLADRPLSELSLVAFDTEATSYSNVSDRLIEVAGERFRFAGGAWACEGVFEELVRPGIPIPEETRVIHGITDAMVAAAAPDLEVLERFFAFADGALPAVHYAPADVGMMTFAYTRAGRVPPPVSVLDTSTLAHSVWPGLPGYSLEALAARLALPRPTHRALPDARTTRTLVEACVARLGDPAALTVGDLLGRAGALVTTEEFAELPLALPPHLEAIDQALAARTDLTIEYRGGSKGRVPRRVTPEYLFARQGHVFLVGFCHLSNESKAFRIDRIERASAIAGAAR